MLISLMRSVAPAAAAQRDQAVASRPVEEDVLSGRDELIAEVLGLACGHGNGIEPAQRETQIRARPSTVASTAARVDLAG